MKEIKEVNKVKEGERIAEEKRLIDQANTQIKVRALLLRL